MKIKIIILLSFFYLCANAQQRNISVDVNKVKGELAQSYLYCVGAGRANEGLRADWQLQLKEVQEKVGFKYIRFHGILTDDMGVYFEDKAGKSIYNWQNVDRLYDFLHSVKIKPIVELSFMPSALARIACCTSGGSTFPPVIVATSSALCRRGSRLSVRDVT